MRNHALQWVIFHGTFVLLACGDMTNIERPPSPLSCTKRPCDENATCDDTTGEPVCTCKAGYRGNGTTCTDIDECADGLHACPDGCENTPGSYICIYPETCLEVRQLRQPAADGEHTLYWQGDRSKPWRAYCHDMAGAPREFLTLQRTGQNDNFSQYPKAGRAEGSDVRTSYTRIRLDPRSSIVDTTIRTFATSTGRLEVHMDSATVEVVTHMPYGTAKSCDTKTDGQANINLTGTPFTVTSEFAGSDFAPRGRRKFNHNRQIVDIFGGGFCGMYGPSTYLTLGYAGGP